MKRLRKTLLLILSAALIFTADTGYNNIAYAKPKITAAKKSTKKTTKKSTKKTTKKSTKKKKVYPKSMKTYVTYRKMYVGEKRRVKVANSKASIKVNFTPSKVYNNGIGVTSSDSSIIAVKKVDNKTYDYIGKKPGSATLTIRSRGTTAKKKKLVAKVRITVKSRKTVGQMGVEQRTLNQLQLIFNIPAKQFNAKDIKVSSNNRNINIVNAEYLKDNISILLTLSENLVPDTTYDISCGIYKASFKSSDFVPKHIEVLTKSVKPKTPTAIALKFTDAQGTDVTNTVAVDRNKIKINLDSSSGNVSLTGSGYDAKLYMFDSSSKAKLLVQYDNLSTTVDVVCSESRDKAMEQVYKSTIAYNNEYVNWDAVGENSNTMFNTGENNGRLAVLIKTSEGKYISNILSDKYYSPLGRWKYSTPKRTAKFKIDENTGLITCKKEGSYAVKVELDYDGDKYSYFIPVISKELKLNDLNLTPSLVTVSNRGEKKDVRVSVRDSLGRPVNTDMYKVQLIEYRNADRNTKNPNYEPDSVKGLVTEGRDNGSLTVDTGKAYRMPAGTYYYLIRYGIDKDNYADTYLTVKITDSTNDVSGSSYQFKDVVEKNNVYDITVNDNMRLSDIKDLEKGLDLGIYSYNQFGSTVNKVNASNYKINGKSINYSDMPYISYSDRGIILKPVSVTETGDGYTVKKLIEPGGYYITAEYYDERAGRMLQIATNVLIKDTQRTPEEGRDYTVKRSGSMGTTVIKGGMSGTPSDVAAQLITNPDGSRIIPQIEATALDLKYGSRKANYISSGNPYLIDYALIPVTVITTDGVQVKVPVKTMVNIQLQ